MCLFFLQDRFGTQEVQQVFFFILLILVLCRRDTMSLFTLHGLGSDLAQKNLNRARAEPAVWTGLSSDSAQASELSPYLSCRMFTLVAQLSRDQCEKAQIGWKSCHYRLLSAWIKTRFHSYNGFRIRFGRALSCINTFFAASAANFEYKSILNHCIFARVWLHRYEVAF